MEVFPFWLVQNLEKQGGSFRMMKAEELVLFSTRYSSSRGAALAQARNDQTLSPFFTCQKFVFVGFSNQIILIEGRYRF